MACFEEEEKVQVQIPGVGQEDEAAVLQGQATAEEPAAGSSPAEGERSMRLGQFPGLSYPNIRPRIAYHPAVLVYGICICFSELSSVLMPSGTWAGKEPPPLQIAPTYSVERRHCFGLPLMQLTSVYMVSAGSVIPMRVVVVGAVLAYVSMTLGVYFMASTSFMYILGLLVFPLWSFKFTEQFCFIVAFVWAICGLMYFYLEFLYYFKTILALMPNALLAGALAPLAATVFSSLTGLATCLTEKLARPGLAPTFSCLIMSAQLAVGDILRLVAMMGSGDRPFELAMNGVLSIAVDLMNRTMILSRWACKIRGRPLVIDAASDLFLRLRFSATYYVPLYFSIFLAFQAIAGIEWAQQPGTYVGLAVYLSAVVVSDLFMTVAHRRLHPRQGEGFMATASRLATQPKAHWPKNQPDVPIPENLWKPTAIASTFKFATDELLASFSVVQMVSSFAVVSVYGYFGPCGIYYHLDNC